jgi:hypothetical protein
MLQGPFLQEWKSLEAAETALVLQGVSGDNVDAKTQRLRAANVFQVRSLFICVLIRGCQLIRTRFLI